MADTILLQISKVDEPVEIDLDRLTEEQKRGAMIKGFHEFLKDAHAGVDDKEAKKVVLAKRDRLYDGAVPGLGRSGGGKKLSLMEKLCREVAQEIFAKKMKAETARKAAMDYEATLRAAAQTQYPDDDEQRDYAVDRNLATIEDEARRRAAMRQDLPDIGLDF